MGLHSKKGVPEMSGMDSGIGCASIRGPCVDGVHGEVE
jgi:hypothetical protein